jgi:hypothetical protein
MVGQSRSTGREDGVLVAQWFKAAQNEANPALRNGSIGLADWRQIRFTSSIAA